MALRFASRSPERLFFPTVHVHDGEVHDTADFDHALFAQGIGEEGWRSTGAPARVHLDVERTLGLVDGDAPLFKRALRGSLPNRDTWAARA